MLEGAIEPKAIAKRARELGFPAAGAHRPQRALCGDGLLGRMPQDGRPADHRHDALRGAAGERGRALVDWLALYAQDEAGYANLCALVSDAHLERPIELDAHLALEAWKGAPTG
jgi:DNA polymerase-3 subunit alpha